MSAIEVRKHGKVGNYQIVTHLFRQILECDKTKVLIRVPQAINVL